MPSPAMRSIALGAPVAAVARGMAVVLATALVCAANAAQASAGTITYVYDDAGHLVAVTDPLSETAKFKFDALGNLLSITRQSSGTTTVVDFAPKRGVAGSQITISGTGFSATASQNTVKFNGVVAVVVTATPARIVAVVPPGASSGTISVTSPGGTSTSATVFTVGANAPTISSLSPNVGAAGASFTITGTNFETVANNDVTAVGPTRAQVTAATATSLSAVVPRRTGSGHVTVATPDGKVVSTGDFFVPPPPYVGADVNSSARMAIGETKTAAVSTANKIALLVFDGTAGQRISLKLSSVTIPGSSCCGAKISLLDPYGATVISPTYFGTNGSFIDATTLPLTGTYTVAIDPESTATGSAALTLYDVPPDVTGTITPGGGPVTTTVGTPAQNAVYSFAATQGQQVSIRMSNSTFSSGWLTLYRSDGSEVALTSFSTGFIDTQTLDAGTYTIEVDPSDASTGSAVLTLFDVPQDVSGAITPGGPPVTATTGTAGQNAGYTFPATAGQRVSLRITNSTYGSDTVRLVDPDGQVLASSFSLFGARFIDATTLNEDGLYRVEVDPSLDSTGSVTLTLYDVPPDFSSTIAAGGPSVTATMGTPGQNAALTFDGVANQRVSVRFSNSSLSSASVRLKRGTSTLQSTTMIGSNGFLDTQLLTADDSYRIEIDPGLYEIGSVDVTLHDVPGDLSGSIATDGTPLTSTIGTPGQNASYTFDETVGHRVSLKISGSSLSSARATIVNPDNSNLTSITFGTAGFFVEPKTITGQGTHKLTVDPSSYFIGAATFALYDVPADDAGTMTIDGPASTVSISTPGQNGSRTFTGAVGQAVKLTISGVTIGTSGCCSTRVSINNPDGTPLASPSFFGTGGGTITKTLTQAGTHTIVINPQDSATGNMTLTLTTVPAAAPQATLTSLALPIQPPAAGETLRTLESATSDRKARAERKANPLPVSMREFQPPDTEAWRPNAGDRTGAWQSDRPSSPWSALPPRLASSGETALSGRVLSLRGLPIPGVRFALEDADGASAETDQTGRFLITGAPVGHYVMTIDGSGGGRSRHADFGTYEVGVAIHGGRTNVLPYTIWLPRIDHAHAVKVSSPTKTEVVVTTPRIPGLEVRIPAGSRLTDKDGRPVRRVSITPIPVDRPPFPLPRGVEVPIYFTVQPGGAYVAPKGARIIYPNYMHLAPGSRVNFWHYYPHHGMEEHYTAGSGWRVYGHGTVTPDGRQVVPDPGVVVREFTGAMIQSQSKKKENEKPKEDPKRDGEPVDLASGYFGYENVDFYLPDTLPIDFRRINGSQENGSWSFGIGTTNSYDYDLVSANLYTEADLVLPDGGRVHYVRTSPGTGFTDAVFEPEATPSRFYRSRISWNGHGWDLKLTDGTVYVFGDTAPLEAVRDRYGNTVTLTRANTNQFGSGIGNITQITSPNGRWVKLTYDAGNRIIRAEDNTARAWTYTYDTSGRLTKATNPAGGATSYAYDTASGGSHRVTKITDPRNTAFITNQYDSANRVIKQTQGDGTTFQFAYTLTNGRISQTDVTNPRGSVRRVTFSANGYATSDTYALGKPEQQQTTYQRDPASHLITSTTDALGRTTTYTYDSLGNVKTITQLAGTADAVTTSYTYEPVFNQVATVTDGLNHTTTAAYDSRGLLTSVTDARQKQTTYEYNAAGQPLSARDPLGHTTRYEYSLGDLVATTDALNRTTTQFVDAAGRLVAVTNSLGGRTRTTYDALDRPTKLTDPLGQATSLTYDGNGNVLTITDARGNATTYTYDPMDRLLTRKDPLRRTETYAYDQSGNVSKLTDRRGKVTAYGYDALDRRTFVGYGTVVPKSGPTTYESTITFTYDGGDRMTKAVDSVYGTLTGGYDGLNRLTSETTPQGSVTYTYDAAGRRRTMTVAGQPAVTYDHDDADRLTGITQGSSTVDLGYDDAGRRTTLSLPNGVSASYTYDGASQLTGIAYAKAASPIGDLTYTYDANGRRIESGGSFTRTGLPAAVGTATYDAANQLTNWSGSTLTYDANGNLTAEGATRKYTWNARNELDTVADTGLTESFQYDPAGRRSKKTVNGATTQYLYDGNNAVQEQTSGGTANLLAGLALDETFTRADASGTSYFVTDALGSTVALTDSAGALTTQYTYEPFGRTTVTGAANANSQQFTGRELDTASGLYYNRARYYSPTSGRFLAEDPISFAAGDPNLYAYAAGDPVNLSDPTGCSTGVLRPIVTPFAGKKPTKTDPTRPSRREKAEELVKCLYLSAAPDCAMAVEACNGYLDLPPHWTVDVLYYSCIARRCGWPGAKALRDCWKTVFGTPPPTKTPGKKP